MNEDRIITLYDDEENEVEFELLDLIEYESEEYVVLLPCDEADEADEVVILRVVPLDDSYEDSYASVEDERLLNVLFEIFKMRNSDQFNFED